MRLVDEIQSAIQAKGGTLEFAKFVESAVRKDANGKSLMRPEDFSIKALYEAFNSPIGESVDSTAFAKATGALINQKVIDGYESAQQIGDQLVTVIPSSYKQETIVGFNALDSPQEVGEGMPYQDSNLSEKWVQITNTKYGRILSITEETIMFDQTGQILVRAYMLGEKAALHREKLIVQGVTEISSNVYKPSGTGTTLYTSSSLSATSPLGTAGLQTVENKLMEFTDSNSDPITVPKPWLLLVPSELMAEARRLYVSDKDPDNAENGANIYMKEYAPLTSPHLTSSTDWYLGNFKREFAWTEVYPLQVLNRPAGHEADFLKDIRYQFKVRFYGGIGAVDNKYVIKATA